MNWIQIFEYLGLGAFILWSLVERGFTLTGQQQHQGRKQARFSFCLISLLWYGAMVFSILDVWGLQLTKFTQPLWGLRLAGLALAAAGLSLRFIARKDLGKQYSVHIETSDEHQLVTTGIYRTLRHPAYLGLLGLFLGIPLCMGSWGGLALAAGGGIPAVIYRITVEEKSLAKWFGDQYREYQQDSWHLLPYLW